MAGGDGTRLWPASIPERPKQLLDPLLESGRVGPRTNSLLFRTVKRLEPLIQPDATWIVTAKAQVQRVRDATSTIPALHVVAEPQARNTAAAIALGAIYLRDFVGPHEDPTLVVLPADHHITHTVYFHELLETACLHAEAVDAVVTLGITPDRPATSFGYIERTHTPCPAVDGDGGIEVFVASHFVEKPDHERAQLLFQRGNYLWNAGIFIMRLSRIERELQCHSAAWAALRPVAEALARGDSARADEAAAIAYAKLDDPQPIDIEVMEKIDGLRVIPADVGWTDLGSWQAIYDLAEKDQWGNAAIYGGRPPVLLDAEGCLTWSEEAQIAIIGLQNIAVIHSGDRILVMPRDRAQDVRTVVRSLHERSAPRKPSR